MWLLWISDIFPLVMHWSFNTRYIKSYYRLPLLLEHAQQYCEVLHMVVKQPLDQEFALSPEQFAHYSSRQGTLVEKQKTQFRWFVGASIVFGILSLTTSYFYVYKDYNITLDVWNMPIIYLLNILVFITVL